VELELCKRLKAIADADKTLDQYGIRRFAEAFDVVPRTLAENSGEWLLLLSCARVLVVVSAGVDCSFLVSTYGFTALL
jgi:chaperonin GroEL (HSP60 family)